MSPPAYSQHAASPNPFDDAVEKYWARRHELFSRFDEGIQLDRESLFSIKPEKFALQIAANFPEHTVVDGMCGVGGVTIALARLGKQVIAVDIDESRIELASHNARIYGVRDAIRFECADIREFVGTVKGVGLYLDPPWGGPDYYKLETFQLRDFSPDVSGVISAALSAGCHVGLSVPQNFDMDELTKYDCKARVIHSEDSERRFFSTVYMRA
jgi:trimethylguanosine synthase